MNMNGCFSILWSFILLFPCIFLTAAEKSAAKEDLHTAEQYRKAAEQGDMEAR